MNMMGWALMSQLTSKATGGDSDRQVCTKCGQNCDVEAQNCGLAAQNSNLEPQNRNLEVQNCNLEAESCKNTRCRVHVPQTWRLLGTRTPKLDLEMGILPPSRDGSLGMRTPERDLEMEILPPDRDGN